MTAARWAGAASVISITTTGQTYVQSFDTLPSTGTFTVTGLLNHLGSGGLGFSGMDGWYFSNILVGGSASAFRVDDGNNTAGGTFSYGAAGSADRALGSLTSTTV